MAIIVFALWIGSAIAGWYWFWPWLVVPVLVIGLRVMRASAQFRTARERNGIPLSGRPGTSMAGPNKKLLVVTFIQHLVLFGIALGLHRLIG